MQLKKHIKRINARTCPCRKCGGNHPTKDHQKPLPVVETEDE